MPDTNIDDLKFALQQMGLSASLRGRDRAIFLFVEHDGKAVEISDHEGRWWLEFWEASEDEGAPPVKDGFFATPDQAVDAATRWLLPRKGPGDGAARIQTTIKVD